MWVFLTCGCGSPRGLEVDVTVEGEPVHSHSWLRNNSGRRPRGRIQLFESSRPFCLPLEKVTPATLHYARLGARRSTGAWSEGKWASEMLNRCTSVTVVLRSGISQVERRGRRPKPGV
jgi:hypothetical protein